MDKNVIVYIGGFALPDKNAAAHRVLANANAFRDLGYEVVFIGINKEKERLESPQYVKNHSYYEVKYPQGFSEWMIFITSIKKTQKILEKIGLNKIHSLCLYNFPSIAFWKLLKLSKKHQIKVFADITEWPTEASFSPRSAIKNFDTFLRMKYLHFQTNGVIAISSYLTEYYKKKKNLNVVQVPPLVDATDSKWHELSYKSKSDYYEFFYAGSPGSGRKDRIDYLVKAFSEMYEEGYQNFKFTVIGITKEQYIESFNVTQKEINSQIEFLGRKPHIEVLRTISRADFSIFYRPSNIITQAGFPTKFVESISCGTPVITNKSSNLSEYYDNFDYVGILIDNFDEEMLKKTLIQAVQMEKSRIQEMKNQCFKSKLFDYSKYKDSFKNVLN